MVISDDNDEGYLRGMHSCNVIHVIYAYICYLIGSITGKCTVDGKPGYLVNTGGRQPLRYLFLINMFMLDFVCQDLYTFFVLLVSYSAAAACFTKKCYILYLFHTGHKALLVPFPYENF